MVLNRNLSSRKIAAKRHGGAIDPDRQRAAIHSSTQLYQHWTYETLDRWFKFYNEQRPHQALKIKTPKQAYELHQQAA